MFHTAEPGPWSPSRWHVEQPLILSTALVPPSASQAQAKNCPRKPLMKPFMKDPVLPLQYCFSCFHSSSLSLTDVLFRENTAQFLKAKRFKGPCDQPRLLCKPVLPSTAINIHHLWDGICISLPLFAAPDFSPSQSFLQSAKLTPCSHTFLPLIRLIKDFGEC